MTQYPRFGGEAKLGELRLDSLTKLGPVEARALVKCARLYYLAHPFPLVCTLAYMSGVEAKDRFDALMRLAEYVSSIREARRQHEWRVSLGLWIGMGAAVVSLRGVPKAVLAIALPAVVVGHAWLWVRHNYNANERDARLGFFYADTAERLLHEGGRTPDRRIMGRRERAYEFLTAAPTLFQVLATALLAGALALFASLPSK